MSKLPNIQILRAVAASAVVLYHSGIETTSVCVGTNRDCSIDVWTGGYGVGLFFVISGFIMVATSWNSFGQPGAALDFMRRRINRIVPLYWLLTTFAVVGVFFVPTMLNVPVLDPAYVAASYLFWPITRVNGLVRPIANLGWTLNLEMMFYVVFALALPFSRRLGLKIAMLFLSLFTLVQMTDVFAPEGMLHSIPLNFWADPIILNFIFGMGFAVLYKHGTRFNALESLMLIGLSCATSVVAYEYNDMLNTYPESHFISRMASAIPPMFLFVAAAMGPQVDVNRKLWQVGLLIGDASYSLYLIHPFLLRAFSKLWIKFVGTHLPAWDFTLVCPFMALAGGLCCYYLAERPFAALFNTTRRRTSAAPQMSPGV